MNLNRLAYCYYYAYFVFGDSLSAEAGPTFNSIYTIYKSFSRILWPNNW